MMSIELFQSYSVVVKPNEPNRNEHFEIRCYQMFLQRYIHHFLQAQPCIHNLKTKKEHQKNLEKGHVEYSKQTDSFSYKVQTPHVVIKEHS